MCENRHSCVARQISSGFRARGKHAHEPGPSHLAALRALVQDQSVDCVLLPAGPDPGWGTILTEGQNLRSAPIDPTGAALPPGPALYQGLIDALAESLATCLAQD